MSTGGPLRFVMGGQIVEVSDFDPQLTVLEWLRTSAARPGSKEGCAEGDCGACTVVLGELDAERRERFWCHLDSDTQVIASGTGIPEPEIKQAWRIFHTEAGRFRPESSP